MEATVRLSVGNQFLAVGRRLTRLRQVLCRRVNEVVVIQQVVAGVVRRIDVDELDLAEVRLLQELQGIEVVALDEQISCRVEVDGLLAYRPKRLGDGRVGSEE